MGFQIMILWQFFIRLYYIMDFKFLIAKAINIDIIDDI